MLFRKLAPTLSLLALSLLAPTQSPAVCGDVSGDRKVTTADALSVLKTAVGQPTNLKCTLPGGDCTGNPRFLLGEWTFQSEFDEVYVDNYDLFAVDEPNCGIVGQDLNDLGIIFAAADAEGEFDYALLDPGETQCDFFLFDRTAPNEVDGYNILLDVDEDGYCIDFTDDSPMGVMIGDRVTNAAAAQTTSVDPALRAASGTTTRHGAGRRVGELSPTTRDVLHRLIRRSTTAH